MNFRLLLLLGLGGGLGDLDVGELILADGADGVGVCSRQRSNISTHITLSVKSQSASES